jgi:hypothetical protein
LAGPLKSLATALTAFALLAACTTIRVREGTDLGFFTDLNGSKGGSLTTNLSRSPSYFVREMSSRGASCFDAVARGAVERVVCAYAICRNGRPDLLVWQMNVASRNISKPQYVASDSYYLPCQANLERLEEIQKLAARHYIVSAGEEAQ